MVQTLQNPKNGNVIETDLTDAQAIEILRQKVASGSANAFETSICSAASRNMISMTQRYWLHKLATYKPNIVNLSEIKQAFHNARDRGLKFSDMNYAMQLDDGRIVHLSLAGKRSKNYGSIYVTDGRAYPDNTYYGRIDHLGEMELGDNVDGAILSALTNLNKNTDHMFV